MEDRGERRAEVEEGEGRGEDGGGVARRPEERAGVSVEVQIGRKLREIGDRFQQDHLDLVRDIARKTYPFGRLWPTVEKPRHNQHRIKIPRAAVQPR